MLALGWLVGACDAVPGFTERAAPSSSPAPSHTAPWRAPAAASAVRVDPEKTLKYTLAPKQEIAFSLKTRTTTITGVFPIVRGTLDLDPVNLKNSEASLRVDLGAVRITSGSEDENRRYSVSAQNWLNIGASIPEATRDARRWATLVLEEVQEAEPASAHEARVDKKRLERFISQHEGTSTAGAIASEDADARAPAPDDASLPAEIRVARVRVRSSVELNNRRVTQPYSASIEFHYPATATPGFPPDRIVVTSAGSYKIALDQYQIVPRNPAGMLVASDLKLLGTEVARTAHVTFVLEFVPAARKAP